MLNPHLLLHQTEFTKKMVHYHCHSLFTLSLITFTIHNGVIPRVQTSMHSQVIMFNATMKWYGSNRSLGRLHENVFFFFLTLPKRALVCPSQTSFLQTCRAVGLIFHFFPWILLLLIFLAGSPRTSSRSEGAAPPESVQDAECENDGDDDREKSKSESVKGKNGGKPGDVVEKQGNINTMKWWMRLEVNCQSPVTNSTAPPGDLSHLLSIWTLDPFLVKCLLRKICFSELLRSAGWIYFIRSVYFSKVYTLRLSPPKLTLLEKS